MTHTHPLTQSIAALRDAFNTHLGCPRLIAIMSPT